MQGRFRFILSETIMRSRGRKLIELHRIHPRHA